MGAQSPEMGFPLCSHLEGLRTPVVLTSFILSLNKKWRRKKKEEGVGLLSRADGVSGADARREEGTPQLPSAVIDSSRPQRMGMNKEQPEEREQLGCC